MYDDLNFWTYSDEIPDGVGFGQFGPAHIIWLDVIILITIIIGIYYKKSRLCNGRNDLSMSDASCKKDFSLKVIGCFLVFLIVLRIVVLSIEGNMSVYELPLHLCSLAGFVCCVHAFFKWDFLGQVIYSLCLPGTVLALLFPDWSYYPAFNFITVQAFLFHGGIVLYTVLGMISHSIRPSVYKMWKAVLFLVIIVPVIYVFDRHFDVNYMFLLRPSYDSPLEWMERFMGKKGYLIGYAVLTMTVITLMNVIYGAINGFKRADNDN